MSLLEAIPGERAAARTAPAVALYSATSFLSAMLLFSVEPMFSKMVLPVLGGTSAVWSIATVVFQALLLAGYVYAWFITTKLSQRSAATVHLAVLIAAAVSLPIAISPLFGAPPTETIAPWLIGLFLVSMGLPFFAVAASAPLLQAWYGSATASTNPYFLYRASNLGSFFVLLAYPVAIEPKWGLAAQSRLWTFGYSLLALALAFCAAYATAAGAKSKTRVEYRRAPASWRDRLLWCALGLVPSGLLVAVTAHISTDVAAAPFLWILPLALYLLTFVLAFAEKPVIPFKWLLAAQPATLAVLAVLLFWDPVLNWSLSLVFHLAVFFVAAMVCHTLLYRARPEAAGLTEFYVWMSLGGVIGGIFAALVAPVIFDSVLEYPLLVLAAFALRPDLGKVPLKTWRGDLLFVAFVSLALAAAYFVTQARDPALGLEFYAAAAIAVTAALPFLLRKPAMLLGGAAMLFLVTGIVPPGQDILYRGRSFFGVYKVLDSQHGAYHLFFHGTTAHGAERMIDADGKPARGKPEPLAYYYRGGALGNAIEAARGFHPLHRVSVVGLGIGAMSCYREQGESWTFYELDPLVVRIARDTALFRSFTTCAPNAPVVLGDARLTLAGSKGGNDLLLLDAFTSDSVPVHLLTREAFALYKAKLAGHGVVVFHISNRNLELAQVVAASAAANGMATLIHDGYAQDNASQKLASEVAVVARSPADLAALKLGPGWKPVRPVARMWTDDYSNILGALLARHRL